MRRLFLVFISVLFLQAYLLAQLSDTTLQSFYTINKTVVEKSNEYGASKVLVVLDVDNTMLKSDSDLGSDLWYRWQRNKLEIKPKAYQKLADSCLFSEAIPLLYDLGTMSLTEHSLKNHITDWQNKGVTVIGLTSRSPLCRMATERDLLQNGINLKKTQLRAIDGSKLILNDKLGRELSYANGLMMTSGMHKGKMLGHILGRSGKKYDAIIFVDDTRKNIDNVKQDFKKFGRIELSLFYYTKVFSERKQENEGQLLTQDQADNMAKDWEELIIFLNSKFPERREKCSCIVQ